MEWGSRVTYLASTAHQGRVVPFGIKDSDRQKHLCVLGKVGSGRAELLARMALQDIERGVGVVLLDTGTLGPLVMERLTPEALARVIHLDAADAEYPFSWHLTDEFRGSDRGAELFAEALPSVYGVSRSPLTDFLSAHIIADPTRTILEAFSLLTDEKARAALPEYTGKELEALRTLHADAVAAFTENGRYLVKDTMMRNLVGQTVGKFSVKAAKQGGILIVDLSRIRVFPTRVAPLIRLFTQAFRVTDGGALYLHDCLRYFTEEEATALVRDSSYALTLSDTAYRETDRPLRERVLSACGSIVTFVPHQLDVPLVEPLFYPYVKPEELQGLEVSEACVRLTIDGTRTRPFFARALELEPRRAVSLQDALVEARKKYATARVTVDQTFKKPGEDDQKPKPPFGDAFKNIFAKRDPAKALEQDVKKDPARPEPETQPIQQSVIKNSDTEKKDAAAPPETRPFIKEPISVREIPEDELRSLLHAPLPA